ncbi:MAG: hypothetical protein MRZ79_18920, partial [Bacteroidia bacterium]|nr:hypothetical protein [Bacteroidia bacterium]
PSIPVEEFVESNFFDAIAPLVLMDFEDGVDPYSSFSTAGITDESGIKLSAIGEGRGSNYLTIRATVPSGQNWDGMGQIDFGEINLADFNDPHLTFLINTNGKRGYFQVEMEQDGAGRGGHFVSSLNEDDDYTFPITDGWVWRSIRLSDFSGNNGGWGDPIDPTGIVKLGFGVKQGNGGNSSTEFELNLDQVMITDGKRNANYLVFDFEDGIDPYSGAASSKINGVVGNFDEKNYLNVELLDGVGKWNWTGAIENTTSMDLSELEFPYLSFAINTGTAKGYIQVEAFQNDTKWGIGQTAADYFFETNGEWQVVNLLLTPELFSNWGGNATEFDPSGILDYVKIGFTTGNIENEKYEVNIDEVYISDGKVF